MFLRFQGLVKQQGPTSSKCIVSRRTCVDRYAIGRRYFAIVIGTTKHKACHEYQRMNY
jgi:hypothetical protein